MVRSSQMVMMTLFTRVMPYLSMTASSLIHIVMSC